MTHTEDDREFQVATIDKVEPCDGGWVVTHNGWGLFCTSEKCGVEPQVGETMFMFGRGIGYEVRGIEIGGRTYRYKTAEQMVTDNKAWCAEQDRKRAVETAEMLVREAAVAESGEKYAWRDGMGEISGFGGGYEEACRQMLRAGLHWLDAHPDVDPQFHGYKGVFGVISEDNEDAKALSKAVLDAVPDCSGAMHQAAIGACLYVRKNGWDAYCVAMSRTEEP